MDWCTASIWRTLWGISWFMALPGPSYTYCLVYFVMIRYHSIINGCQVNDLRKKIIVCILLHFGPFGCCLGRKSTWWHHQMETFSTLWAICAGNSLVLFLHKGQWRGALMFSTISACINGWVNNPEASDFRCRHAHYDVMVMNTIYCHTKVRRG